MLRTISVAASSKCRAVGSRGGIKAGSIAAGSIRRGTLGSNTSSRWANSNAPFSCKAPGALESGRITDSRIRGKQRRLASTKQSPSALPAGYAIVYHGGAYEEAIAGRHGAQLRLAHDEGIGKDDPPYDPFAELLPDEEGDWAADERSDGGYDEEEDGSNLEASEKGGDADADAAFAGDQRQPLTDDGDGIEAMEEEENGELDEDEELEALAEHYSRYNKDGSVRRPKSELVALKSGLPAGGLFAVVDLNGSQQKVTVDDVVIVNKLRPVDKWSVGNTLTLTGDDVLLMGSTHLTLVGLPGIKGAEVDVMVEEITRDATTLVFKKRKRKHSRRKNGFRREVTMLRVLDIRMPERCSDHEHRERV